MHDPIFQIFRDEAGEHLKSLEHGFLELESVKDPQAREPLVGKLFRHAHNLKGDARALNLLDLQQIAANLEELLESFRENPDEIDTGAVNQGLKQLDSLQRAFDQWQQEVFPSATGQTGPSVEHLPPVQEDAKDVELPLAAPQIHLPVEDVFTVRVSSENLDRMLNLAGEVRVLQRADVLTESQLKDLRERLLSWGQQLPEDQRQTLEPSLDHLRRIEVGLHQRQSRKQTLMQALEEDIRTARLLPLSMLADALRRPVRDLAQSVGKEVRFQVEVGDVLLDKAVMASLRAPLLHLIRNAVDHGIELPGVRTQLGKPSCGTIRLSATRRGKKVLLQIADDGAGINVGKIKQRLVSRGIASESDVETFTVDQLCQWVFQPGFSTAEVGDISGRGVGLDVVREALQRIQGKIELNARQGQGATFTLSLPVTISTIRILSVWCGGQCFGIPTENVLKTGRVRKSDLQELKGTRVITLNGEPVRWVGLNDLLQIQQSRTAYADEFHQYLVLLQDGNSVALHVDDVGEEREVLLKPLEFPLSGMPGILGGTIRPDGAVQLVLDVTPDQFDQNRAQAKLVHSDLPAGRSPQILVVDDSPTTRALLRNVFVTAGYQVQTAVDGVDALEKLRRQRPDLVVCDFEMPRMNGLDLTRQIKAKWNLPVILVTGREQEQHRHEGLEAGADAYLEKSTFRGDSLMDVVKQFISD